MTPNSILGSVKKMLQVPDESTDFDLDITIHINSTFSTLNQIGIGPLDGFMIEDETTTWASFLTSGDLRLNSVKSYMYLCVRLLFDPPTTSFTLEAFNKQKTEFEWRLNVHREEVSWVDPMPSIVITDEICI